MDKKTPEEVLRSVSNDLKRRGITHAQAAEKMHFRSKQTVSNILAAKKYMSASQALKFADAFGYDQTYLMSGEGELLTKAEQDRQIIEESENTLWGISKQNERQNAFRVLYWVQEVFSKQNNIEGMAICAEISKYLNAPEIAKMELKDYKEEDYAFRYVCTVKDIQDELGLRINKMIEGIAQ